MPTLRVLRAPDDDRPPGLSQSTINILVLGWTDAPLAPAGEFGRWQLALMTAADARALYEQHREWLFADARRRGLQEPWAERHLPRPRRDP